MKLNIIHDEQYANWVFDPSHPTQGRRFINGYNLIVENAVKTGHDVITHEPRQATREELARVHADEYIDEVTKGISDEWVGERLDLGLLAERFAGGTIRALELLLAGEKLAIHLPGAKHHAGKDHSSGFCVYGDLAIAASIANDEGLRVAILDTDAHHGDGTEELCMDMDKTMTFSIHQEGIFPFSGATDYPMLGIYNSPLPALANDRRLVGAVREFIAVATAFKPDLVFIAAGADGHVDDPLSDLRYTPSGYFDAMYEVAASFPNAKFLMGGAGGYLPDSGTPQMWTGAALGLLAALG